MGSQRDTKGRFVVGNSGRPKGIPNRNSKRAEREAQQALERAVRILTQDKE